MIPYEELCQALAKYNLRRQGEADFARLNQDTAPIAQESDAAYGFGEAALGAQIAVASDAAPAPDPTQQVDDSAVLAAEELAAAGIDYGLSPEETLGAETQSADDEQDSFDGPPTEEIDDDYL